MSRTQFALGPHIHTVLQSPRPPATSELSYRGLQDKLPCSGRRLDSPPWKNPCTLTTIDLRNQRNHQAERSKPSWVSCRSRPECNASTTPCSRRFHRRPLRLARSDQSVS